MSETTAPRPPAAKRAALGSFLGTMLEYFDFAMYGIVAAVVFSRVFFPADDPTLASIGAMATFGVAYIARPIGAFILGHFGDRIGRQKLLLFTITLMGISTFLIGCLPTYEQIGVAAPIMLVILRLLQGFSASGEQAGASSLAMEHAPTKKRALYTSWTNAGTGAGNILGQLAFLPILALPEDQLLSWGWRIPFLVSIVGTVIVILIRRTLHDAEVFVETQQSGKTERFPVALLLRHHWRNLIRVILMCVMAAPASIVTVFAFSYAVNVVGIERTTMLLITLGVTLVGTITIPFWGILADRIGRKPVFIGGLVLAIVFAFPFMHFVSKGDVPMIFLFELLLMTSLYAGQALQLPIYTEMFETKVRFSGVAVGTQIGYLLAGFAPTICFAILQPGELGWWPVAVFSAACCVVAAIAALTAKETRGVPVEELDRKDSAHDPETTKVA